MTRSAICRRTAEDAGAERPDQIVIHNAVTERARKRVTDRPCAGYLDHPQAVGA